MGILDSESRLIAYADDSFEIDSAEYVVNIIYTDAYEGDIDIASCVVELGGDVTAIVGESSLIRLKPELIKRLDKRRLDEINSIGVV